MDQEEKSTVSARKRGLASLRSGERFIIMTSFGLLLIFGILFILGSAQRFSSWQTTKYWQMNALAKKGYALTIQHSCQNCHLIFGIGEEVGPVLDGEGTKRSKAWLTKYFQNPASVQPNTLHNGKFATNFSNYTPQQKKELVAFMMSLRSLPGNNTYPKAP